MFMLDFVGSSWPQLIMAFSTKMFVFLPILKDCWKLALHAHRRQNVEFSSSSNLGISLAFSSEVFPAPDCEYKRTAECAVMIDTSSSASSSRPKKNSRCSLRNERGPTYGSIGVVSISAGGELS